MPRPPCTGMPAFRALCDRDGGQSAPQGPASRDVQCIGKDAFHRLFGVFLEPLPEEGLAVIEPHLGILGRETSRLLEDSGTLLPMPRVKKSARQVADEQAALLLLLVERVRFSEQRAAAERTPGERYGDPVQR